MPPRNIHFTLRYGLYKPYGLYELSNSLNFASLSRMLLSRHIELMPGIQENHIKNIIDHMSGDDMCAVHMYPCPIGIVTDICRILKSALCGKRCRAASAAEGKSDIAEMKGEHIMRIAVTYEDGNVYQHFGHTEQFKIYDTEEGRIVRERTAETNGSGHGALAGFLKELNVDTLICGGIGAGAQNALDDAGIRLCGGVSGNADEAVKALLAGNLVFDPDVRCSHHGEDGQGDGHRCGAYGEEHHCGGHGEGERCC